MMKHQTNVIWQNSGQKVLFIWAYVELRIHDYNCSNVVIQHCFILWLYMGPVRIKVHCVYKYKDERGKRCLCVHDACRVCWALSWKAFQLLLWSQDTSKCTALSMMLFHYSTLTSHVFIFVSFSFHCWGCSNKTFHCYFQKWFIYHYIVGIF